MLYGKIYLYTLIDFMKLIADTYAPLGDGDGKEE